MKLIQYKLNQHPKVGTMPMYFHLMFKHVVGGVNGRGEIINPKLKVEHLETFKTMLDVLTKEHPVGWQVTVHYRGKLYDFTAENGQTEYVSRPNQNDNIEPNI